MCGIQDFPWRAVTQGPIRIYRCQAGKTTIASQWARAYRVFNPLAGFEKPHLSKIALPMTKIVLRPSGPQSAPRLIATNLSSRFHKSNVESNYHELEKRLQPSPEPPSDQEHQVADPLLPVPSNNAPAEFDKAVADQIYD